MSFKEMNIDTTYKSHEDVVLKKWLEDDTYKKLIEYRKNVNPNKLFRFMDGPPFVSSSNVHMGHVLVGSAKAFITSYKMMKGYNVLNKLGFDVHGLPSENYTSSTLNLKTKQDIEEFGIEKYNKFSKEHINKTINSWKPLYDSIGRWCDFDNTYKTMDTNFMESVWWVFKQLWEKDLVYKGVKVMAFSYGCGTSLSNFEAGQSYKDITSKTVYVYFPLQDEKNIGFAVWTTTPWTLPANLALCVNPEGDYVKVFDEKQQRWIIILDTCVQNLGLSDPIIEPYKKGFEMLGLKYVPIFSHLSNEILLNSYGGYTVVTDNYVSLSGEIGTGIVHICPCHGEDDYRVVLENNIADHQMISELCQVDDEGKYTNKMGRLSGKHVMDNDTTTQLIIKLKKRNAIIKTFMYKHSYPHCYRTDTPLIYKTVSSFFVAVSKITDDIIKNNKKVNWIPSHVGSGRFEQWLKNTKDWGISRTRFFGTPIPVWISEDGDEMICIGSIEELRQHASLPDNYDLSDIHPEFIWPLEFVSKKTGKKMKCVKEIFDCWFESGSVPFGQLHYPFNKETRHILDDIPEDGFLSDFICEGVDQCRGWFYTLMVLSTAIFNKPAFKNVICSGLILAEDGQKLSKRLGNFKDPHEIIKKYGSDYVRLYVLNSPAIKADTLCFNEEHVYRTKQKIIPWINSVIFFLEHVTNFQKKGHVFNDTLYKNSTNIMDRWIVSNLGNILVTVTSSIERYEIDTAINTLTSFIDDLTNWYVRINRDRLKDDTNVADWGTCLSTLYFVQYNFCIMMAPAMPFLTEFLFEKLNICDNKTGVKSVFSMEYPAVESFVINNDIVRHVAMLQDVVLSVRQMRQECKELSSTKKPLKQIKIMSIHEDFLDDVKKVENYLTEEINCLSVEYELLDKNDEEKFKNYTICPNQKSLGKKYRKDAKPMIDEIKATSNDKACVIFREHANIMYGDIELINGEDFNVVVEQKSNENKNIITKEKTKYTINIDTTYDESTQNMYMLRVFITKIQNMRKENGLHPWDPININFHCDDNKFNELLINNIEYLKNKLKCDVTHNNTNELTKIINIKDTQEYQVRCEIERK